MAEREVYKLLEERTISGRGLFKIPPSDNYRNFLLYVSVVRVPPVDFLSSKYNPDRSEYAKIVWLRKDYVMSDEALNYKQQVFEANLDPCGYIATAVVCFFADITDYLSYLAPFMHAPPLVRDPSKKIYIEPLRNCPDTIKIVCRSSAAIVCKLYALKYDVNCPDATPSPKPPPDPLPVPEVPPGTGVGVSPPYSGADDNGDTTPHSLDTPDHPPPPGGEVCKRYLVKVGYDIQFGGNTVGRLLRDVTAWGKIGSLALTNDGVTILTLECQGIISIVNGENGAILDESNERCAPAMSAREIVHNSVGVNFHFGANASILSTVPL